MTGYCRYLILLILLNLTGIDPLAAQMADTIWNQTDAQDLKQGYWRKYNRDGNLLYKGFFKDGKPVGKMERFYENGTRKATMIFIEGTDITYASIYYRKGSLAATGKYVNMVKDSLWRYYSYYTDDLMYTENYTSGKKNGVSTKYYPGGQLAEIMTWEMDMKQGLWKQFYEDSTVRLLAGHDSDQLHGKYRVFNRNKILIMDGVYTNGKMDGTWHFFDEEGIKQHTLHYVNGDLQNKKDLEEWAIKHMEEIEKNLGKLPEVDIHNFFDRRE
jgi:antitoxin component YwqK of YwqJK toxin-antitoxin module